MPVPTMLSRSEIDYLYWLAKTQYTGRGRVVELGCFFGGSTMPLVRGLKNGGQSSAPLITYDSFVMDSDTAPRYPVGLGSGDSFLPIFQNYLRDHLDCITVRPGWLPIDYSPADDARIYPEQQPIEILFIDAAKHWSLHDSILQIFGRHLFPGSIVIQQDFKHHSCYWLALHMFHLRTAFEPLHDVVGGASVAFRFRGGLSRVPRREQLTDPVRSWREVHAYWQGRGTIPHFARLAAATHFADEGMAPAAIEQLRAFLEEAPLETSDSHSDTASLNAEFIAACRRVEAIPGGQAAAALRADRESADTSVREWRSQRQEEVIRRCVTAGHNTVALYGAGRHTSDLLASGWPKERLHIAAILDDYSRVPDIAGIPVVKPANIPPEVQAIVVSSETSQEPLAEAARVHARGRPIVRIYI